MEKFNRKPELLSDSSVTQGSISEINEIDPRGTDILMEKDGTITLRDDLFSIYTTEIVSQGPLGQLDVNLEQNFQTGIHEIDWNFEVLAEEAEYLAKGESIELDYQISLNETFLDNPSEQVDEFSINLIVEGTNDQPVVSFDSEEDIS